MGFSPWGCKGLRHDIAIKQQQHAKYHIQRNDGLDDSQTEVKIAGRNTNNFRYTDDTSLKAEIEEQKRLDEGARGV